jgi:beta-glucosidase-like glycosyl hydrolase
LAIGTESRALYNEGSGHVWLFAPNINLIRDPRWGRSQEVPGEDATLVAAYAAAFVRGIQASPMLSCACVPVVLSILKFAVAVF